MIVFGLMADVWRAALELARELVAEWRQVGRQVRGD